MRKLVLVAIVLGLLALPGVAQATSIDFTEFPVGTVVTNQYAPLGVNFLGYFTYGPPVISYDLGMPTAPVLASPDPLFVGIFEMAFTGGATGVSFLSGYWDTVGAGAVGVYDIAGGLITTLHNESIGVETFDLSSYGRIGYVVFDSTRDPADIDNLTFTSAVPDPASTLLLFGLGLTGLAALRRRRG